MKCINVVMLTCLPFNSFHQSHPQVLQNSSKIHSKNKFSQFDLKLEGQGQSEYPQEHVAGKSEPNLTCTFDLSDSGHQIMLSPTKDFLKYSTKG